jgi:hypothetical protein
MSSYIQTSVFRYLVLKIIWQNTIIWLWVNTSWSNYPQLLFLTALSVSVTHYSILSSYEKVWIYFLILHMSDMMHFLSVPDLFHLTNDLKFHNFKNKRVFLASWLNSKKIWKNYSKKKWWIFGDIDIFALIWTLCNVFMYRKITWYHKYVWLLCPLKM